MKNFKKLAKVSYDFYLPMLFIVLFTMTSMGYYDIRITSIQDLISRESVGYNLCETLQGTIIGGSYFNFYMLLVMTILIVFLRKLTFYNGRTIEFFDSLPIKKNAIVIFDYIMMLGIGVITILIYGIMLSLRQTDINIKIMNQTDSFDMHVLFSINGKLFLMVLELCIFFAIYYTLCYIGITMAKNALIGAIFTGLSGYSIYYLLLNVLDEVVYGEAFTYFVIPSLYFEQYKPSAILPACILLALLIILLIYIANSRNNESDHLFVIKAPYLCIILAVIIIYDFVIMGQSPLFIILVTAISLCAIILIYTILNKSDKVTDHWEVK